MFILSNVLTVKFSVLPLANVWKRLQPHDSIIFPPNCICLKIMRKNLTLSWQTSACGSTLLFSEKKNRISSIWKWSNYSQVLEFLYSNCGDETIKKSKLMNFLWQHKQFHDASSPGGSMLMNVTWNGEKTNENCLLFERYIVLQKKT